MEKVVARPNMLAALRRVERNAGAPGIDGVRTGDLLGQCQVEWPRIREELLNGTYEPLPVRRVEIPKSSGQGMRKLGIPTAMDRLIQQALLQVLTPILDPDMSQHSYGFRPGRRAQDAVEKARQYIADGYEWVVDIDLEDFFNRVNHDMLMARVARKVEDKRVPRLIRRYLECGVLINGVVVTTEEGTPQGGPLSPLLSNVMLDDLDKELERRGHRFVRYADDGNVYVRTRRAGERVMASIRTYLQERLKLKVNEAKSAVDRPERRTFLGFSFYRRRGEVHVRLSKKALERVKRRIREMTGRSRSQSMDQRLRALNAYLAGWFGYYGYAKTPSIFKTLDEWTRHRLRACVWKQWKRQATRERELVALGMPRWQAWMRASSGKGIWRMAAGPLNGILGVAYWRAQGYVGLSDRYQKRYA